MTHTERIELKHYPRMGGKSVPLGKVGWVAMMFVAGFIAIIGYFLAVDNGYPRVGLGVAIGTVILFGLAFLEERMRVARWNAILREYPGEWWRTDSEWDPTGQNDLHGRRRSVFLGLIVTSLLLIPLFGMFLNDRIGKKDQTLGLICAAIFIVGGLIQLGYLGWKLLHLTGQRFKYGRPRLLFDTFPFFPGGSLQVRLIWNEAIQAESVLCILRLIEEKYVREQTWLTSGRRRTRHRRRTYEIWSSSETISTDQLIPCDLPDGSSCRVLPIQMVIPARQSGTYLRTAEPYYWELEVRATTPGIDYGAHFLIPIYNKSKPESATERSPSRSSSVESPQKKTRRRKKRRK